MSEFFTLGTTWAPAIARAAQRNEADGSVCRRLLRGAEISFGELREVLPVVTGAA